MPQPIGVLQTDRFFETLTTITGRSWPAEHDQRARAADRRLCRRPQVRVRQAGRSLRRAGSRGCLGFVPDGDRHRSGPLRLGARTGKLRQRIEELDSASDQKIAVVEGVDFAEMEDRAEGHRQPDLIVGNSKGFAMSRKLGVPLVRVGFPIHDRIDGPRMLHVGYRGAQQLFDRIANTVIEAAQESSPVGYTYM